jgi:hypothetical protein
MAVYNPKTKRYEDQGSAKTRPQRNYDFSLPISTFSKKYLSYKYTPEEFTSLAKAGYVGSFGGGALGFKAPAYDVKRALTDLRNNREPSKFALPQNYTGNNLVNLAETPNPTGEELGAWYSRAKDFNLADYVKRYGHAPSEDSVYYQMYKPSESIQSSLEDRRKDALKVYGAERDQEDRYTLIRLAKVVNDPNIRALSETLPIIGSFTASERKKADQILRDFGLTGLGSTTIPYDLESKYMLPANNPAGSASGNNMQDNGERSTIENMAINSIPAVGPLFNALSQNETLTNLVASPTSPLAPTPADQVNPVSFIGNLVKGAARAGLGFPMGVAELATNPIGATKGMLKDYGYRYGSAWGDPDSQFIASTLEDPLAPIMDILGLIPVVGAGVKGAQVAKIAATTTKGVTAAGKVANATKVARAREFLDAVDNETFIGPTRPEDVTSARTLVDEAADMPVSTKPSRMGMNPFEFARVQRASLNGDVRAEIMVGEQAPNGFDELNSGYAPTAVDRAAAFFEPRWTTFSQADILPEGSLSKADAESIPQQLRGDDVPLTSRRKAPIRFAGSPLARGAQKVTFFTQKKIASKALDNEAPKIVQKTSEVLARLPLTGFNYRYSKAIREDVDSIGTMNQREMLTHKMMEELIDVDGEHGLGKLTDAEQLALMSQVSGKLYSPNILRSIIMRNLEMQRDMPGSIDDDLGKLLEFELAKMDSPEFMSEYEKVTNDMLSGAPTARGQRLLEARNVFRRKMDLAHHEAGIELDGLEIDALRRIYAPAISALRLEPESILRELSDSDPLGVPAAQRIAKFDDAIHMFETLRVFDQPSTPKGETLRTRIDAGEFDDLTDANGQRVFASRAEMNKAYDEIMEAYEIAADALSSERVFRSKGGVPFVIVDDVFTNEFGSRMVRVRMLRVRGESIDEMDFSRGPVTDSEAYVLPLEVFNRKPRTRSKDKRNIINFRGVEKRDGMWEPDEAFREELTRASLNYTMKMFPDARDFTDKIGTETFKGPETFDQRVNEYTIAASGFLDYHLKTQFKAHMNAADRRFNKDIQRVIEDAAVPMTMASFNAAKGSYKALRTMKLFDSLEKAENYAGHPSLSGRTTPGEVIEVNVGGRTMYATKMRFVDASKVAMKEARERALLTADEWEKQLFEDANLGSFMNENDMVMAIPKSLSDSLTKSYERSSALSARILNGSTDIFKLMALSLNPRFVSQQIFGGAVMLMLTHPMQAGHVMAGFFQYGHRNMMRHAKRRGRNIDDSFVNHKEDYDILFNKFIRDFEDNIYMEDAQQAFWSQMGESASRASRYANETLKIGYTISFALEKNLRIAVLRESAKNFPGFKKFLDSDAVAERAAQGMPDLGYPEISKFNAAIDLLSDESSKFYNPMFLREIRHSADMVSGNYRDFTKAERAVRNTLIPFYAWTRHSAMFTKRLVQERPLTANAVYNVGNYGYEQIYERGGLPDWLLESVPMPTWVEEILGLDPAKENRVGFGSINPFGTMAKTVTTVGNAAFGGGLASPNSAFEFTNPFINAAIEQQTGKSLLTGAPNASANKGLIAGTGFNLLTGLPLPNIIANAYKSEQQLNKLRGNENPADVFKDPNDPDSKLSIPEEKLNTKFPTFSPAGLFNTLAPARVYSVDPKQMGEAINREFEERGLEYEQNMIEYKKGAWRTIKALAKWKATRDHIEQVWMPEFGASNPEMASRVLAQLKAEYPKIPDGFPNSMVAEVLSGQLSVPDAVRRVDSANPNEKFRLPAKTFGVEPDAVEIARISSHNPDTVYDRPAGSENDTAQTTIDANGYIKVNGVFSVNRNTGKRLRVKRREDGSFVYDEQGLPVIEEE